MTANETQTTKGNQMTVNQKIAKLQKSIELQRRIRETVAASRLENVSIEIIDIDRILSQCDELIQALENRIAQVERRSVAFA